jgi:hypothetical protein
VVDGGRLRTRVLLTAATLNQQGEEQNDVNGEHREKDILESLAAM